MLKGLVLAAMVLFTGASAFAEYDPDAAEIYKVATGYYDNKGQAITGPDTSYLTPEQKDALEFRRVQEGYYNNRGQKITGPAAPEQHPAPGCYTNYKTFKAALRACPSYGTPVKIVFSNEWTCLCRWDNPNR